MAASVLSALHSHRLSTVAGIDSDLAGTDSSSTCGAESALHFAVLCKGLQHLCTQDNVELQMERQGREQRL